MIIFILESFVAFAANKEHLNALNAFTLPALIWFLLTVNNQVHFKPFFNMKKPCYIGYIDMFPAMYVFSDEY